MLGTIISFIFKSATILVLLLALFIGFLTTPYAAPFWNYLDNYQLDGQPYFKGFWPIFHSATPWHFTYQQLNELDLHEKTVLITGANAGLGYWTAYHLASRGAHVILTCRNQQKCDAAEGSLRQRLVQDGYKEENIKLSTGVLELDSFESILAFAKELSERKPKVALNSLILNAAVMGVPFGLTKDGIETVIAVNHFGHFLLTDLLLNKYKLVASDDATPATIVVVSSCGCYRSHAKGVYTTLAELNNESAYGEMRPYQQSKLANVLFAQELAERMQNERKNILVNSLHPGFVATEISRHYQAGINGVAQWFYSDIFEKYMLWQPKDAALNLVYLAVSEEVLKQHITGRYFHPIARENTPAKAAQDKELQKRLWKFTEEVIATKV